MRLREVLIFPEILSSKKLARLKPFAQLFYRNLMHVCDGAGVFENDPEMLCQALYPRALDRVKPKAVATWLKECQQEDLIGFYTDDKGRALGEFKVWLQLDGKRKRRFQGRREHTPDELDGLFNEAAPPPAPPQKELNGREVKRNGREAPAPLTTLSDEQWLKTIEVQYPHIPVRSELSACMAKYPQAGRRFFINQWIGNWEPPMQRESKGPMEPIAEPDNFVQWFTSRYEKAPPNPWGKLRRESQEYYLRQMQQSGGAL